METRSTKRAHVALGGAWLALLAIGSAWILTKDRVAFSPKSSVEAWPSAATIERARDRWTLLVFAHPKCACAVPSEQALRRLLARRPTALSGRMIWSPDPNFAAFGITVSGEAVLFDPLGKLRFRGGLTESRGHAGSSPGVEAVLAATTGAEVWQTLTPVFGCLMSPDGGIL